MIHEILVYPNKILRETSKDVIHFDATLHELLDDMYETMITKEGIGLAAIQIGVPQNVLIINLVNEEGLQKKKIFMKLLTQSLLKKMAQQFIKKGV